MYAHAWLDEVQPCEEHACVELEGTVLETDSKKIKAGEPAIVCLFPSDHWYDKPSNPDHIGLSYWRH